MPRGGPASQVRPTVIDFLLMTNCEEFSSSAIVPSHHIPKDLGCLVLFEPLAPNYEKQPIRVGTDGGNKFWAPPNRKNAYIRDRFRARLFRWEGGRMSDITATDLGKKQSLSLHSVATIFTQWQDTTHLLAVTFDAETKDVAEENGGWKVLSFDHILQPGTQGRVYSSVGVAGAQQQLAAPGSPAWMPQLLPEIYDYDARQSTVQPISAGLIGSLPLLFALPAFSAQPDLLSSILVRHMRPNEWLHHNRDHGRRFSLIRFAAEIADRVSQDIKERGMVVSVYLDPANTTGSTAALLDKLQNGGFGAFYGPSKA
ncbi:MAG: hypothetical protein Q9182_006886 [Xanthomendoza sp. 2 TL-2023]